MADLHHECGLAAIYHLPGEVNRLAPKGDPAQVSRMIPRLLLEIQNRGQLAAGMTSYRPNHPQLMIEDFKTPNSTTPLCEVPLQV